MEAQPIYGSCIIYDLCEYQDCQCRSCAHDQGGNCLADTGDCAGAREQGRCPVRQCPMWRTRG